MVYAVKSALTPPPPAAQSRINTTTPQRANGHIGMKKSSISSTAAHRKNRRLYTQTITREVELSVPNQQSHTLSSLSCLSETLRIRHNPFPQPFGMVFCTSGPSFL
jgi:hypothetical protein